MTAYDFHPEAEGDLNDIWDYIAEESPDAADRVTEKIVAAIDALVPLPHQGHHRPDLTSRPLRFITTQNYLAAYESGTIIALNSMTAMGSSAALRRVKSTLFLLPRLFFDLI